MTTRVLFYVLPVLFITSVLNAGEYLVKFRDGYTDAVSTFAKDNGGTLELVSPESGYYKWVVKGTKQIRNLRDFRIEHIEKNHKITLFTRA